LAGFYLQMLQNSGRRDPENSRITLRSMDRGRNYIPLGHTRYRHFW